MKSIDNTVLYFFGNNKTVILTHTEITVIIVITDNQ